MWLGECVLMRACLYNCECAFVSGAEVTILPHGEATVRSPGLRPRHLDDWAQRWRRYWLHVCFLTPVCKRLMFQHQDTHKRTYMYIFTWGLWRSYWNDLSDWWVLCDSSGANILHISNISKHTVSPVLNAAFTLPIYDVRTLKVSLSLTSVCFHLSCVPPGFTKGFLRHMFSVSAATQEEKAWPHIKMTPGGNSSVRHTQKYAWKEGKKEGEHWTSTRWLIS